jgi:hypothetical protein
MTNVYAGSCNPARKAKLPQPLEQQPQLAPKAPDADLIPADTSPRPEEHGPYRRGRKPGPLSRGAREAQRKLNHSIIEKARRTKINDALATLRELVPPDFDAQKSQKDEMEEDDDDGDYEEGGKKKGGKNGKEKEFKLEILVRTVGYMQHLVDRVATLEQEKKDNEMRRSASKEAERQRAASAYPSPELEPTASSRLPPIHSWLPANDFAVLPPSQLPSPPTTALFASSQLPNPLNLPGAASPRSQEDEVAASLLLQIRTNSSQKPHSSGSACAQTPSQMLGMARNG